MKETQLLLSICLAIARFTTLNALAIPSEVYNDDETLELGVWLYPDVQNDVTSPPRDQPLLPGTSFQGQAFDTQVNLSILHAQQ